MFPGSTICWKTATLIWRPIWRQTYQRDCTINTMKGFNPSSSWPMRDGPLFRMAHFLDVSLSHCLLLFCHKLVIEQSEIVLSHTQQVHRENYASTERIKSVCFDIRRHFHFQLYHSGTSVTKKNIWNIVTTCKRSFKINNRPFTLALLIFCHYSWWPWLWQLPSKHAPIFSSSWPCFPERLPLVQLQQRRHLPVNVSSLGHPRYAQQRQLCQSSLHARKWDLCRFGGDGGRRDRSPHSAHHADLPLQAHEKQRAFSISALRSAGAAGWRWWWSPTGLISPSPFFLFFFG